jgi:protein TonB
MEGRLIHRVEPVYPSLAKQRHIQGTVRLEALISTKGAIRRLRLLSGHPLLAPAALQAVRKWRYRPLEMNGRPAEVFTEISVEFPPHEPAGSQPRKPILTSLSQGPR